MVWSVDTFSFTSLFNICIKWCDHEYTGMSDKRIVIEWPTFVFASRAQAVTDNRVCTCDCHPMTLVNTCRKRYHVTVTMFCHHGVATSNLNKAKNSWESIACPEIHNTLNPSFLDDNVLDERFYLQNVSKCYKTFLGIWERVIVICPNLQIDYRDT